MTVLGNLVTGLFRLIGRGFAAWGRFFVRRGWIGRLVWVGASLVALSCACFSALTASVMAGQAVGLIPRVTATAVAGVPEVRSTQIVPLGETGVAETTAPPATDGPTSSPAASATKRPSTATALPATSLPATSLPATETVAVVLPTNTPVPPTAAPPTVVPATTTEAAPILVDTATAPPPPPTETAPVALGSRVVIIAVNKPDEYVDIQNQGDQAQDLGGWVLVSEKGNQACSLAGVLDPGATLRIWAMTGQGGFSCNNGSEIWNNSQSDPAVLYNTLGQEVSRR